MPKFLVVLKTNNHIENLCLPIYQGVKIKKGCTVVFNEPGSYEYDVPETQLSVIESEMEKLDGMVDERRCVYYENI